MMCTLAQVRVRYPSLHLEPLVVPRSGGDLTLAFLLQGWDRAAPNADDIPANLSLARLSVVLDAQRETFGWFQSGITD